MDGVPGVHRARDRVRFPRLRGLEGVHDIHRGPWHARRRQGQADEPAVFFEIENRDIGQTFERGARQPVEHGMDVLRTGEPRRTVGEKVECRKGSLLPVDVRRRPEPFVDLARRIAVGNGANEVPMIGARVFGPQPHLGLEIRPRVHGSGPDRFHAADVVGVGENPRAVGKLFARDVHGFEEPAVTVIVPARRVFRPHHLRHHLYERLKERFALGAGARLFGQLLHCGNSRALVALILPKLLDR